MGTAIGEAYQILANIVLRYFNSLPVDEQRKCKSAPMAILDIMGNTDPALSGELQSIEDFMESEELDEVLTLIAQVASKL